MTSPTNPLPPGQEDPQAHWVRNPITTRHSQTALLMVSFFWGLSYVMPVNLRIPFSEVFPPSVGEFSQIPMWGWGAAMLFAALAAIAGERMILISLVQKTGPAQFGWRLSIFSHTVLVAVYATLAIGALITGFPETHAQAAGLISAISRPVLWGYIAYLHLTYARLPTPVRIKRKKKGKLRFFVRVGNDDNDATG
jgi:hypothetical protein